MSDKKPQTAVPTPTLNDGMSINPMDIYNTPRKPDDIDLVAILTQHISALGGGTMIPKFHAEANALGIIGANPVVQRILLNRYLTNKLLVFRSVNPNAIVYDMLPLMAPDGYIEDWLTLQKESVMPYVVANAVLA